MKIPIAFTMTGADIRWEKARAMDEVLAPFLGKQNVLNAPIPHYPSYVSWGNRQGSGRYEIHINQKGNVTEVRILKSSGDAPFDQAAVNALRQWRLRGGPRIIELPLAFKLTPNNYKVRIP